MDSSQVRKPGASDPAREMRPSGSYRVQRAGAEDNGRHRRVKGRLERPDHGPDRCVTRSSGEVGQLAEEVVTEQGRGYCWMAGGAQLCFLLFFYFFLTFERQEKTGKGARKNTREKKPGAHGEARGRRGEARSRRGRPVRSI